MNLSHDVLPLSSASDQSLEKGRPGDALQIGVSGEGVCGLLGS